MTTIKAMILFIVALAAFVGVCWYFNPTKAPEVTTITIPKVSGMTYKVWTSVPLRLELQPGSDITVEVYGPPAKWEAVAFRVEWERDKP